MIYPLPSADSRSLAYGSDGIKLWDVANGKELPRFKKEPTFGNVCSVAYSPDGKMLAYASGYINRPANIVLLDLKTNTERPEIDKSLWGLGRVEFSPDGKLAAAWGDSSKLKVWDAATNKERTTITTSKALTAVAFSPDSQQIATAASDQTIEIWELPE